MSRRYNKEQADRAMTWTLLSVILYILSEGVFAFLWGVSVIVNLAYFCVSVYAGRMYKKNNPKNK